MKSMKVQDNREHSNPDAHSDVAFQETALVNPLGDFLQAHRARLTPEDLGLPTYGTRRVPGLRREELAWLAGISPTYYARLEQGSASNASASIISALARALCLDEDATIYLHRLAHTSTEPEVGHIGQREESGRLPAFEDAVSLMPDTATLVLSRTNDVMFYNSLADHLFFSHLEDKSRLNTHRLLFTDPYTRDLYANWEQEARMALASLRFLSGKFPNDPGIRSLVGELSVSSREFARLWAEHPVRRCTRGQKELILPEWGTVEFDYHVFHAPDENGQRILAHSAKKGTRGHDVLQALAP